MMRLLTRRRILIGVGVCVSVVLVSGVFLLPRIADAHLLYTFQATGTVICFDTLSSGSRSLSVEVARYPANGSFAETIVGRSVISRAFALPPGVLHPGAKLEKAARSRYCCVDGKQYVFVRLFPWQ